MSFRSFSVQSPRQTSLLNDSLIKYYIAWCSLDIQPSGGFCTADATFLFTEQGLQAVPKTPRNNLYVYLPRRMLDPVADDIKKREVGETPMPSRFSWPR